jgi:hypothetical protein
MQNAFVYISGPITAKNGRTVEQNVFEALHVYLRLLKAGIPAFCPHLSAAFPSGWTDVDYETWMAYDFAVIDRCTHVLMLPTWEGSAGARRELDYANAKRIPVLFSEADLLNALKEAA